MSIGFVSLHTLAAWATLLGFPVLILSLLWKPTKWWAVYRYRYIQNIGENSMKLRAHMECCFPLWFRWANRLGKSKTTASLWLYKHLSGLENRELIENLPFLREVSTPTIQKIEYRANYKADRYRTKKITMRQLYQFVCEKYIDRQNCKLNYGECSCGYRAKHDSSEGLSLLMDEHQNEHIAALSDISATTRETGN